jgi:hypothetical protein
VAKNAGYPLGDDGVVVAVTARAHRGHHAGRLAALTQGHRGVLRALVGVMDHPLGRPAVPQGHVARRQDQLGAQVLGHGPADHPATEHIEHDRQGEQAGPGRHRRDIRRPAPIGRVGRERPLDPVGRGQRLRVAHGGPGRSAALAACKADRTHQPGDPLAPTAHPGLGQLRVDAWGTIGGSTRRMEPEDRRAEHRILPLPSRWLPNTPGVGATGGDAQHPTQPGHRILGLLALHERERR